MTDRETFLLLFYRERINALVSRLQTQEGYKAIVRQRHQKNKLADNDLDLLQTAKLLKDFTDRAEDLTLCNDICKGMYFCEKKRGHKGAHSEYGLMW